MLVRVRFLDPTSANREAGAVPGAVRIPVESIRERASELPPPDDTIFMLDVGADTVQAQAILTGMGRRVEIGTPTEGIPNEPGRLWEPNPFLQEVLPFLQVGTALDLGCGVGRDAVFLASLGWKVVALDNLPDAIERGRTLAGRYLAPKQCAAIDWRLMDLRSPSDLGISSGYDLAIMFRYLNRPLIAQMDQIVRPGGALLVEQFSGEHRRTFGKPKDAVEPGDLAALLPDWDVQVDTQEWFPKATGTSTKIRHMARFWAVRPS